MMDAYNLLNFMLDFDCDDDNCIVNDACAEATYICKSCAETMMAKLMSLSNEEKTELFIKLMSDTNNSNFKHHILKKHGVDMDTYKQGLTELFNDLFKNPNGKP